jgi:hypothetical protein
MDTDWEERLLKGGFFCIVESGKEKVGFVVLGVLRQGMPCLYGIGCVLRMKRDPVIGCRKPTKTE